MAQVLDELVVARRLPPGAIGKYTFTLATRTGQILCFVEARYGPRDRSFTLLGLEFCDTGPRCWFPGNSGHIIIQLTTSAMNDAVQACYQLAHECVHLLNPVKFGTASVFEEGVAALFALECARHFQPSYTPAADKYAAAADLAGLALAINPDVVRQLRSEGTPFSAFTPAQLAAACPGLPTEVASVLCSGFQAWGWPGAAVSGGTG